MRRPPELGAVGVAAGRAAGALAMRRLLGGTVLMPVPAGDGCAGAVHAVYASPRAIAISFWASCW